MKITQLDTFLTNIQHLLTGIGGSIFVICVIIAGLMRMLSFGNERRVAISNMAFTAAVIGLAIVLLSVAFQSFISKAMH